MYEIIYQNLLRETGEVPKVTCRIGMAQFAVPQDALEETGRGLFSLRADRLEDVRGRVRGLVERAGENGPFKSLLAPIRTYLCSPAPFPLLGKSRQIK